MAQPTPYDVAVIGGGLVGAALGCALGGAGVRTAVVEAVPLGVAGQPSYDDRASAVAEGSRRILEGVGVWREVQAVGAYPIRRIHVSDRGGFGKTRLEAADSGLDAYGYVVENRVLGGAFKAGLERGGAQVDLLAPARVEGLVQDAAGAVLRLDQGRELRARLVVLADGGRSGLRERLGVPLAITEYGQTAVIANVSPARPHQDTAYERFTDSGPLALLPLGPRRCSLVWTVRSADAPALLALDEAGFAAALQARFGERLGRFERVGARAHYPLQRVVAGEPGRGRVVIIGNAAHSLHPVAGQGLNLGLRDAAVLAELVVDAQRAGRDVGGEALLEEFARWRRLDQWAVSGFTDALVRVFSTPFPPLAHARGLGLLALDLLPPLKRTLSRQAMGLSGRLPRLARGLPL
ncbi:2-octaprenyl-6-methoxyphenyl hydroxylase [Ectothiorhodospiraceae bacterium 2226]|nr:2-octaprenyl-6-methoxyphenyl hydroxylase [Ectothiorhodospiraceae bacterium 2226]